MDEERGRLFSGAFFGFIESVMRAFSTIIPTFYLASMGISIVMYAFLQSIGDVFSFLAKPIVGYLTDKHGERKFLLIGAITFFISIFLIGQTSSALIIAILRIIGGVASALLFVIIIIYGLRKVRVKPDYKVGLFGGIKSSGWIFGLLVPGMFIDRFGISTSFYLILVVGIIWTYFIFKYTKKFIGKQKARVKPSFSFLKKIPILVIYKTMDLAMFTVFLFFFTRYALQVLGLSKGIISIIVVIEIIGFSLANFLVGRISNKQRRKYWIPMTIIFHTLGATIMILANSLIHYFLVAVFIGVAGGFVDVWLFSRISETVKQYDKGKFIATFGWSYDFATIVGAQVPVLMVLLNLNQFASMYVLPAIMGITYLLSKRRA